jgi:hypothetical protein
MVSVARKRPLFATALFAAALLGASAATYATPSFAAAAAASHPDFSGVWEMKFTEYVKTDEGKLPPMKPEALARYKERTAKMEAGQQVPDSATQCLPHGMPRIMYTPYPVLILDRPDLIGFIFEVNHNTRVAYLNEKLPADPDPTYEGYSVARWEGPVLVIDTIGLNDKIQIDRAGLPQSTHTRIQERLQLAEGGTRLKNKITVTDDTLYTAPWSFTVEYKKADYKLIEYVCDNNRPVIQN